MDNRGYGPMGYGKVTAKFGNSVLFLFFTESKIVAENQY